MPSEELFQRIRRIKFRISHLVDEMLGGQYHSAFKGRGIEFEEVREYQIGDDVRAIDWNVTARTGKPYIKRFREERELAVQLLVDLSPSQDLGTHHQTKRELVTEIGGALAFAAIKNNDKVGLTLFSDEIELSVPPKKGSRHGLRLIRELLYTEPVGQGTDLKKAIEHLLRKAKRRSIVFLISDFLDQEDYESALRIAARKHDIVPIVVSDRREQSIPNVGLIRLRNAETGKRVVFDSASRKNREQFEKIARESAAKRDQFFRRLKLTPVQLWTGQDFVEPLVKFFRSREHSPRSRRRR